MDGFAERNDKDVVQGVIQLTKAGEKILLGLNDGAVQEEDGYVSSRISTSREHILGVYRVQTPCVFVEHDG